MPAEAVTANIISGVVANYLYGALNCNVEYGGIFSVLPLSDRAIDQLSRSVFAALKETTSHFASSGSTSLQRRFLQQVMDGSQQEAISEILSFLINDHHDSQVKVQHWLSLLVEKNEHLTENTSRDLLNHIEKRLVSILPSFPRLKNHFRLAHEGIEKLDKIEAFISRETPDTKQEELTERYLQAVKRRFNTIRLSGFDSFLKGDEYENALETSFVSLYVGSPLDEQSIHAEKAISSNRYVTLRGGAGCGKTTLLQWLALQASVNSNCTVPLFIPLRSIVARKTLNFSLASCYEVLVDGPGQIPGMHQEWLLNILKNGAVTVMFDGVDEVPPSDRHRFWEFLETLIEDFPRAKVVVTSRNLYSSHTGTGDYKNIFDLTADEYARARHEWNPPAVFRDFNILGLSRNDLGLFVDRWYQSIAKDKIHPDLLAEMDKNRSTIKAELLVGRNSSELQELASTPMFCALLCLVNLVLRGNLPNNIKELYRFSLKILLQSRDELRGIRTEEKYRGLNERARKELLSFIAYNLQETVSPGQEYSLEVQKETAMEWIDLFVKSYSSDTFPNLECAEILEFLIERVSVIREPTGGYIDFTHRSFLEYLAAEHFVSFKPKSLIRKLCANDQWHGSIQFMINSDNGGSHYNQFVIEEVLEYLAKTKDKDSSVSFVEKVIENLDTIPMNAFEPLVDLVFQLRPIQSERAKFYRNIPIRVLEAAMSVSLTGIAKPPMEEGLVYVFHTSARSREIISDKYLTSGNNDFVLALNRSRRFPLKKQHGMMNLLQSEKAFLSANRPLATVYCDDLSCFAGAISKRSNVVTTDLFVNVLVVDEDTHGISSKSLLKHVRSVYIDTANASFAATVIDTYIRQKFPKTFLVNELVYYELPREKYGSKVELATI